MWVNVSSGHCRASKATWKVAWKFIIVSLNKTNKYSSAGRNSCDHWDIVMCAALPDGCTLKQNGEGSHSRHRVFGNESIHSSAHESVPQTGVFCVTRVVRLTTSLRAQELVVMCVGDLSVCV